MNLVELDAGATMVEYALMVSLIVLGAIGLVAAVGGTVLGWFDSVVGWF